MKSIIGLFIVLSSSTFVFAQDEVSTSTETVSPTTKAWSVSANLETTSFSYKEPGVMNVDGRLNGVGAAVQYNLNSSLWFSGNATYLTGSGNYNGRLQSGKPHFSTDNYKVMDFATKGFIVTDLSTSVDTSLFLGLGRRTTDDLDDASTSDYFRRHIYNYYSLGIHVFAPHSESTSSTWTIGIDTMSSGTTETRLSDVHPSLPDFTMNFRGGNAMNLEWQLSTEISRDLKIIGGLAYKKWTLDDSEIATVNIDGDTAYFIEPRNETSTLAFKIGAQF